MSGSSHGLKILLVDDSEDDILMARAVFGSLALPHKLETLSSAGSALDYLHCRGEFAGRRPEPPDLVLLDINMPLMDGFALLRELKTDPKLRRIPVIMLSSSASREDISRSYDGGAASYITKPGSLEDYKEMVRGFHRYWLSVSALPE